MRKRFPAILIASSILLSFSGCGSSKGTVDPKKYLSDKYGMDEDDIEIIREEERRGDGDYTPVWVYTGSDFLCSYTDENGDTREFAVYYSEKSHGTDKYSDTYLSYDIRNSVYQQFIDYFDDSELDKVDYNRPIDWDRVNNVLLSFFSTTVKNPLPVASTPFAQYETSASYVFLPS